MSRESWPDLPGLLAEIADLVGLDAAIAVAKAKGGQETFIVSRLSDANWLVKAIGRAKAEKVSHHFCSNRARLKVSVPFGPEGSYLADRRRRQRAMTETFAKGGSANEAAECAGVTTRSAWRRKAKLEADKKSAQLKLF